MKIVNIIRVIAAIILCAIGILGSLHLKRGEDISELSFMSLVVCSLLIGLFIAYSDKIQIIDFQKGRLILREMKETETSMKELGRAFLDVIEKRSHSIMLESFDEKAYTDSVERLKKLIA